VSQHEFYSKKRTVQTTTTRTCTDVLCRSRVEELLRGSVVVSVYPFALIEVSPVAVEVQAVSVAVQVCVEGFPLCVTPEAALENLLLAVGDVCLIEVDFSRVSFRPQRGVVKFAPGSDAAVVQPVLPVHVAAVVLALRCAAA